VLSIICVYNSRMFASADSSATNVPERRRSPHQLRDVVLLVSGESAEHQPFQEETFTISISLHGVLTLLAAKVVIGQRLVLVNPATQGRVEGRVARFGSNYGGLAQVGIEFAQPAPGFWPPGLLH
jgi:hypothetical protein